MSGDAPMITPRVATSFRKLTFGDSSAARRAEVAVRAAGCGAGACLLGAD